MLKDKFNKLVGPVLTMTFSTLLASIIYGLIGKEPYALPKLIYRVLNYEVRIWVAAFFVIVFLLVIFIVLYAKTKPTAMLRTRNKIKGVEWAWTQKYNSKDGINVGNISAICPNDDTIMMLFKKRDSYSNGLSYLYECPRCEYQYRIHPKENYCK